MIPANRVTSSLKPVQAVSTLTANPLPDRLELSARSLPLIVGKEASLWLYLSDSQTGQPVSRLQIVHEKPAHMFVVSQDLSSFQHIHPEMVAPGWLKVPVCFPVAGQYRAYLQVTTPQKGEETLQLPLVIPGRSHLHRPLIPDPMLAKVSNGFTYQVNNLPHTPGKMAMFDVSVSHQGQPVQTLEPFLGAPAHGVIISADQKTFAHVHPMAQSASPGHYQSPVRFHTRLDKPGLYKAWVQTQINGQLNTVDWTFRI